MDVWLLIAAISLALVAGALGILFLGKGQLSNSTVWWMSGAFICQLGFLSIRGSQRHACPLMDLGEISVFLAWSLTLFYLLTGPTYRISLLGVFTAPVVVIFQSLAFLPNALSSHPEPNGDSNVWGEAHSATSVMSYGAFALAAIAAVMFLVLDRQLKGHLLESRLFKNLPPARELLVSMERLLWIGWGLLTLGITAAFLMPDLKVTQHLVVALGVWLSYLLVLGIQRTRGITGRRFSLCTVAMFLISLIIFARS